MFTDLSNSKYRETYSLQEKAVAPGATVNVLSIPVAADEVVQIAFEYSIRDRRSRSSRIGVHRAMVNGHTALPTPVPSSHITTDSFGEEPANLEVNVTSTGGNTLVFEVKNLLTYDEPCFISANVSTIRLPAVPKPRIRLTITGMTGGENFEGLSNGIHILEPVYYYRSPTAGSDSYTLTTGYPLTFATGTQCEFWQLVGGALTTAYAGKIQLGVAQGATKSVGYFAWNNGVTKYTTSLTYGTYTGFAKDRVLSGSLTVGAVTFTWEREPTDQPLLWGNY